MTVCAPSSLSPPAPRAADSPRYCSCPGKEERHTSTEARTYIHTRSVSSDDSDRVAERVDKQSNTLAGTQINNTTRPRDTDEMRQKMRMEDK